mgnify:CR=1 FL=1
MPREPGVHPHTTQLLDVYVRLCDRGRIPARLVQARLDQLERRMAAAPVHGGSPAPGEGSAPAAAPAPAPPKRLSDVAPSSAAASSAAAPPEPAGSAITASRRPARMLALLASTVVRPCSMFCRFICLV